MALVDETLNYLTYYRLLGCYTVLSERYQSIQQTYCLPYEDGHMFHTNSRYLSINHLSSRPEESPLPNL